jgi:transcriptional regulator with XRE-family HTH domain
MVERIHQLAALVDRGTVTQTEISAETGVSQSQISRILSGQFRRASKNVLAICRYASLRREKPTPSEASDRAALTKALLTLWDGTPSHARALIDMLSAIGAAQQRSRKVLR